MEGTKEGPARKFSPYFSLYGYSLLLEIRARRRLFIIFYLLRAIFRRVRYFSEVRIQRMFTRGPRAIRHDLIGRRIITADA